VNDTSWRNLSAILGVACVILIIAAGALLATTGEAAPTPSQAAIASASGSVSPSGTTSTGTNGPTASTAPTPTPSLGPSPTAPPKAPIVAVTFNNLMLDAASDINGKPRTFSFITDGTGPVVIKMVKSTTALSKICVKVDDSKPDCRTGTKVNYAGAFTDTVHSLWTVTLVGSGTNTPTIDLAMSWPSNSGKVTLTHGRLQGSSSPGIPEALNGFTATFKTRTAGNVVLAASWTVITTDVDVKLQDVDGPHAIPVDEKQFKSAQNLGTAGYSFALGGGKFYRIIFTDLSADAQRPDLTAIITVP
jgi:hypothetical protein